MSLTTKVLWAMLLGIIVGLVINIVGLNTQESFVNEYIVEGLFYIVGKMFITALKMLVVPLVFFSLISGVLGIGDIRKLGSVGLKSFALYMLTTALGIAAAIGLAAVIDTFFLYTHSKCRSIYSRRSACNFRCVD